MRVFVQSLVPSVILTDKTRLSKAVLNAIGHGNRNWSTEARVDDPVLANLNSSV